MFEDLCHAVFKQVWKDPLAQKNGRRGQAQHGVDVFGSPNGDQRILYGVQCKGKDVNFGSKADWSEVLAEIAKAEEFLPKLDQWIFATTAPADATLQKAARELSIGRRAEGKFGVHVLGWEEIQALMASAPDVLSEFYPEHADHLPEILRELRSLLALSDVLRGLVHTQFGTTSLDSKSLRGPARWEIVDFDGERGLGPALMGSSLGPADAVACPRLAEAAAVMAQMKVGYSTRLVGEPGAGKSICAYQVAHELATAGFEILRLADPQTDNVELETISKSKRLYLVDDAHLMKPHVLRHIEEMAGPTRWVLSTHNAIQQAHHRGAITLDAKRAVRTIATALRSDLPATLKAVRVADSEVGDRSFNADIKERLDHAELTADRPWQFCFILGGGWRRSRQAADAARAAGADLVLAAVALRQLASRDARALPGDIAGLCAIGGLDGAHVDRGLAWLTNQRLIRNSLDCRTPHQRFASVVLLNILAGQNKTGRESIAAMVEGCWRDRRLPYAGLRLLTHELHFAGDHVWTRLLTQAGVRDAVVRCWVAEGADREFAALALLELWHFSEGGARAVVGPYVSTLAEWISSPGDGAYGFGRILQDLAQEDRELAVQVVMHANPNAIALAYSTADPESLYGVAELLRSIASVKADKFNAYVLKALDRDKLRALAKNRAFFDRPFLFAKFCASVLWWDKEFALELAELFIPTAQQVLAKDPISGFQEISNDLAMVVLHAFDVLGVFVGKSAPSVRQRAIARSLCACIDPKQVAEQISLIQPRQFQSAAYILGFLSRWAPRKYDGTVSKLDWQNLDDLLADDWSNMPHDTEVLLGTMSMRPRARRFTQAFIAKHASRIERLPPRLMLIAPEVGLAHVAKGGSLRLGSGEHLDWYYASAAAAILAEERPDLVEQAVRPFVDAIARSVSNYFRDSTGRAEGFIAIVVQYAPEAWREVLAQLDPRAVEQDLAACITKDEDHRRLAAVVIESALTAGGPVGEMALRLRKRFPKASIAGELIPTIRQRRRASKS